MKHIKRVWAWVTCGAMATLLSAETAINLAGLFIPLWLNIITAAAIYWVTLDSLLRGRFFRDWSGLKP